ASLDRLARLAPEGFVLAIGSRARVPLRLATWRAHDLLLEIGPDELRLSREETRDYLASHGLELDDRALNTLYAQTEGWMVGVQLNSLLLRHQPEGAQPPAPVGGDPVAVGDHLLRSVFEQLPADMQEVLLS